MTGTPARPLDAWGAALPGRPPALGATRPPMFGIGTVPLPRANGAAPYAPDAGRPPLHPGAQPHRPPAWPAGGRYAPADSPPAQRPDAPDRQQLGGRAPRPWRVRALTTIGVLVAVVGTLGVVASAFALSFDAIRDTAVAAYVRPSIAWLYPVAVDGAMAVAVVCAVLLQQAGRRSWYPWLVVLAGAAISVACNAMHAYVAGGRIALPREWAMAVSAMPAVLLALSVHLVVVLALAVRAPAEALGDRAPAPGPARPMGAPGATGAPGIGRPARRPTPPAEPANGRAPNAGTGRSPVGATPPAEPGEAPADPGGNGSRWATHEQLLATLAGHYPGERIRSKQQAARTLRDVHGSCADKRADAARKEHNERLEATKPDQSDDGKEVDAA